MRLTSVAIYGYMALLVICAVFGVFGIFTWFSSLLSIFVYPVHLGVYVFAAYYIFKQKKIFDQAEFDYYNGTPI